VPKGQCDVVPVLLEVVDLDPAAGKADDASVGPAVRTAFDAEDLDARVAVAQQHQGGGDGRGGRGAGRSGI
jgi:hypothetical protein